MLLSIAAQTASWSMVMVHSLSGAVSMQAYQYMQTYKKDYTIIKVLVCGCEMMLF